MMNEKCRLPENRILPEKRRLPENRMLPEKRRLPEKCRLPENHMLPEKRRLPGNIILPEKFRKYAVLLIAVIFVVSLPLSLSGCEAAKPTRYEATFLRLFDTKTTIITYTDDKEEFSGQAQLIYDSLEEYHKLYDIYNSYEGLNNLKTVNDQAGIAPVKVDRRIIDLLKYAKEWHDKTDGEVNVALGAVLRVWHDYRERGMEDPEAAELPPMEELERASGHTDINKVIIDEDASTVFLEDPEMSLDVGAIAKGYAVEQVSRIATENGFTSGIISVGGNVRTIGSKGDAGQPWNVGIQNPDPEEGQSELHILDIIDASLVTSGIYERYYTVAGKDYHHVIDPDTLFPSGEFKSVSILCRDSGMADVLSTAVFNMSLEEGMDYIESIPDAEAFWVLNSGEFRYSSHFRDYIRK
jgi:thiamine biosynthesis lipoprotein